MDWCNLYGSSRGRWLKGNLHTHTVEGSGCSHMTLPEALARYTKLGYDFLCISNHMTLTSVRPAAARSLLLLPGVEWNSPSGDHMTICSFDQRALRHCVKSTDPIDTLRYLADRPALVTLNHPNWKEPPHYSREQLMERKTATGMEIYNGVIEPSLGNAFATEKWDYVLSRGHRTLGFASDDAHAVDQIGQAWIMARVATRTPQAVFDALRAGNFYCSTGVTMRDIRRRGSRITVDTMNADELWAVGPWGARLERVMAKRMEFDCAGRKIDYVRFVAFGRGAAMAWTQPFFLNAPPVPERPSPYVKHWWLSRVESCRLSNAPIVRLNSPMEWKPIQAAEISKGFVDLRPHLGNQDGVVYLANRFTVARTGRWIVSLGHDGGARMFLDGQCVIDQPLRRNPAVPDRSQATVRLTRGQHEIVVALDTDHGLGQGIFLRFIEAPRGKAVFPRRLKSR